MRMCFTSGRTVHPGYRNVSTRGLSTIQTPARGRRPGIQGMLAPFTGPRKPCGSCGGAR